VTTLPTWLQFLIVLIVADFLPLTIMVLIANSTVFPVSMRTPLLIVGTIAIKGINNIMPVKESVKDMAAHAYLVLTIVFLVLAIKNGWLWNKETY
jgi:hypothetical protein